MEIICVPALVSLVFSCMEFYKRILGGLESNQKLSTKTHENLLRVMMANGVRQHLFLCNKN
jgi:hypothetical protein